MAKKNVERRPSQMKTVTCKVIVSQFGIYNKGDKIEMHKTTADACVKGGAVELVKAKS
jgi:hypothetical protein